MARKEDAVKWLQDQERGIEGHEGEPNPHAQTIDVINYCLKSLESHGALVEEITDLRRANVDLMKGGAELLEAATQVEDLQEEIANLHTLLRGEKARNEHLEAVKSELVDTQQQRDRQIEKTRELAEEINNLTRDGTLSEVIDESHHAPDHIRALRAMGEMPEGASLLHSLAALGDFKIKFTKG